MASDFFDFKKFRVWHNQSAMKVGTDAVVLACLLEGSYAQEQTILDIGTGSGIISLMLAQRFPLAKIHGLEIDFSAASQAQYNFENSIYSERLTCIHTSFQDWIQAQKISYQLIVSNPPFYNEKTNFSIENKARSVARHDAALPFEVLAAGVANQLDFNGKFWLILPIPEAKQFSELALTKGLFLNKEISIYPRPGKQANRVVQCYQLSKHNLVRTELFLRNEAGDKSKEYHRISDEFYL